MHSIRSAYAFAHRFNIEIFFLISQYLMNYYNLYMILILFKRKKKLNIFLQDIIN